MSSRAIYDDEGEVTVIVSGDAQILADNTEGTTFIDVPPGLDIANGLWRVEAGELVAFTPPAPDFNFHKQRAWQDFKQVRDAEELSPFTWNGMTFDADRVSQSRIQGAVQLAMLDPDFTVDWTLADNSVITLTGPEMMQVGGALGIHVTAAHVTARLVRDQIEAATTEAELAAITWPA